MKPRAFIGSSVEGLSVAYAVQQNLLHDAEVTVWDQGVFGLSAVTIESLNTALSATDFGIFVFSPDDIVTMRDVKTVSVRDNVLFEMGLFIGKLGRERVFFLIPASETLHIPSDLLGVAPAKYESKREDGSMQAATGPACNQMRIQIKRLGLANPPSAIESTSDDSAKAVPNDLDWAFKFIDKKYAEAKQSLETRKTDEAPEVALITQAWIHYCDIKLDETNGLQNLLNFAKSNLSNAQVQCLIASFLRFERDTSRAINVLTSVDPSIERSSAVTIALANCYAENEEPEKAVDLLRASTPSSDPNIALLLAELLERQQLLEEAIETIHDCHIEHPKNELLRYRYARIAHELERYPIALYLLDGLSADNPSKVEYWGYLGNSCLSLQLFDRALTAYRKAESLLQPDETDNWIISNIGNLLSVKGLPSEACLYLQRAIEMEKNSDYAHDRLSSALKKRAEEEKEFDKKRRDGLRMIKEIEALRPAPEKA